MTPRQAHLLIPIFAAYAPAHAETSNPAAPADFTAGLKQLAELGLPEAPGARWVAAGPMVSNQLLQGRSGGFDQEAYQVREVFGPSSGYLWFIPASGDATPSVIVPGSPGIRLVELDARMFGGAPGMADIMRKQLLAQLQKAPAAKIAEDIDGVIERLDKKLAESRKSRGEGENYWAEQQEAALGGRLLLFAAQAYRAGEPAVANKLAAAVFKNFPRREVVLNAAISTLADQGYFDASETLKKDGDWARYAQSLKELLAKFPRGWENRPAVAKLLALVEKRATADGSVPPALPPGIKGDAVTLAALRALAATKAAPGAPAPVSAEDTLWILPALPAKPGNPFGGMFYGGDSEVLSTPEVKALTKAGFAALPALAAAAGDETLTPLFTTNNGRSYSSGETPEAKTKRLFDELRRPMTRGEIVRALLTQILPGEEYKLRRLDPDAFAETVETFRAEHAKDSPVALASFYLKDGSFRQKQAAMRYIARSEDPAAGKVFEDTLLESEDIEGRLNDALEYLRLNRAKAAGFAPKLVAKLKENLALPDERPAGEHSSRSSNGVTRLSRKWLENQIKAVEALASGKSARELLLEAVAKPAKEAMPLLNAQNQSLQEMPLAERVSLLLEAACAAREAEPKFMLVGQLGGFAFFGGESKEKYAVPAPGSPDAKRWLQLFDDKAEVAPGNSVGLVAAFSFESLCETPPPVAMFAMRKSGKPGDNIFVRRAKARLAGETIPDYPDPAKVSKERLTTIVATVATTPDDKLEAYIDTLNADERIAWTVWWSLRLSPESAAYMKVTLPEVAAPEAFKDREKRLSSVASNSRMAGPADEADEAYTKTLLAAVGLAPGEVVDAARVEAVCAALARDAAKYSGSVLMISRSESSLGLAPYAHREKIAPVEKVEVFVGTPTPSRAFAMQLQFAAQRFDMEGDFGYKGADAAVVLQVPGAGVSGQRVWRVKDGKVAAPEALDATAAGATPSFAQIVVLTAKDAAVILPEKKDAAGNAVDMEAADLSGEDEE